MSRYRYEVDENNAIRAWDNLNPNEEGQPFLLQPEWPDGTPWADRAEAELWAQRFVASMEDIKNGRPGENPANPFHPWVEEQQPVEE